MGDDDVELAERPVVDLFGVRRDEGDVCEPGPAGVALSLDEDARVDVDAEHPPDPRCEMEGEAPGSRADIEDGPAGKRLLGEPPDQRG